MDVYMLLHSLHMFDQYHNIQNYIVLHWSMYNQLFDLLLVHIHLHIHCQDYIEMSLDHNMMIDKQQHHQMDRCYHLYMYIHWDDHLMLDIVFLVYDLGM